MRLRMLPLVMWLDPMLSTSSLVLVLHGPWLLSTGHPRERSLLLSPPGKRKQIRTKGHLNKWIINEVSKYILSDNHFLLIIVWVSLWQSSVSKLLLQSRPWWSDVTQPLVESLEDPKRLRLLLQRFSYSSGSSMSSLLL